MSPDWQRLFPAKDHRFQMGLRVGDARTFWTDQEGPEVRQERQRWLRETPGLYTAELLEGREGMQEARAWIQQWTPACEADWVVLSEGVDEEPRVLGGEVVFPSSWSLPEKLGQPLSSVHGPVPGLGDELGKAIQVFLSRIQPASAWERENWGLAADAELNHHPALSRPRLDETARLHTTWIRLERQFLTRLSVTRGLLFGIRVSCHRLEEVAVLPGVADGLTRSLETMSEAVVEYKGLRLARESLLRELRAISPDASGNAP